MCLDEFVRAGVGLAGDPLYLFVDEKRRSLGNLVSRGKLTPQKYQLIPVT